MPSSRRLAVLLGVVALLSGCGSDEPDQNAKDACSDLRRASADYADQAIDAATYLGLLDVVVSNAVDSNAKDLVGAGTMLGTALAAVDETDTLQDVAHVGSMASMVGDACDDLGL